MTALPVRVTLDDIQEARSRIADGVAVTPCRPSPELSRRFGFEVVLKHEYLQATGSFKERGARNALLQLDPAQRRRGVVAASAGNHALGLAHHARSLGIPATVVMPRFAPLVKSQRCQEAGARVLFHGQDILEAKGRADEIAAAEGLAYIHGYDDPAIIAGQGTLGLELLEQVSGLDAVVIPVGGGGLLAGVGVVMKALRPAMEVIGVEPERCASFTAARAAGRPVPVEGRYSLADGLAVAQVGANAFATARDHVDDLVTIDERELALAIVLLMQAERCVVEGSGAAPVAACLGGKLERLAGRRVALVLAGANIDLTVLGRIIDTGLVASHRLYRFRAVISDRPGGLARLAAVLGEVGASIKDVTHDRTFAGADLATVGVLCTVETRDEAHVRELQGALGAAGIPSAPEDGFWGSA